MKNVWIQLLCLSLCSSLYGQSGRQFTVIKFKDKNKTALSGFLCTVEKTGTRFSFVVQNEKGERIQLVDKEIESKSKIGFITEYNRRELVFEKFKQHPVFSRMATSNKAIEQRVKKYIDLMPRVERLKFVTPYETILTLPHEFIKSIESSDFGRIKTFAALLNMGKMNTTVDQLVSPPYLGNISVVVNGNFYSLSEIWNDLPGIIEAGEKKFPPTKYLFDHRYLNDVEHFVTSNNEKSKTIDAGDAEFDVLKSIKRKNELRGRWVRGVNGSLISPVLQLTNTNRKKCNFVEVPVSPKGAYTIKLKIKKTTASTNGVDFRLPYKGGAVRLAIGRSSSQSPTGFKTEASDSSEVLAKINSAEFPKGKNLDLEISVSSKGLTVTVDGKKHFWMKDDISQLKVGDGWQGFGANQFDPSRIQIGVLHNVGFEFVEIKVVEISE